MQVISQKLFAHVFNHNTFWGGGGGTCVFDIKQSD